MGQPLSEKRKELARKYIESEGVNEPVLEELNRLMKPLYYYCIGDYYKSLPLNDIDDFYQIGYVTLWKVLEKCRKKPDIINSFSSYMMTAVKNAYATEYRNYILKNPIVKVGYEPKGAGGYYYSSVFFNTQYRDRLNEKAREIRCQPDDLADAICLCIAAALKEQGLCETIPEEPEKKRLPRISDITRNTRSRFDSAIKNIEKNTRMRSGKRRKSMPRSTEKRSTHIKEGNGMRIRSVTESITENIAGNTDRKTLSIAGNETGCGEKQILKK